MPTRNKGEIVVKKRGRQTSELVTLKVAKGLIRRDHREKRKKEEPCQLYKQYADDDTLLYVGISGNALVRTGQHAKAPWASLIARVEISTFPSRARALKAETWAIEAHRPVFNRRKKIKLMTNAEVGRAIGFTLDRAYAMARKGDRLNTIEPIEFKGMTGIERRNHNRALTRLARQARRMGLKSRITKSDLAFLE